MNEQRKFKAGKLVGRGIEWCDYSWNPVKGCFHACQWKMKDSKGNEVIANCYAEDVANKFTKAYPQGFEHHYFDPKVLPQPANQKVPSKIFCDSMSDLFGAWVPDGEIAQVFNAMDAAPWHTFQSLTKWPKRLVQLPFGFPKNLWVGCSSPPDFMFNKEQTHDQQVAMLRRTLNILNGLKSHVTTRWMSMEPYSWDMVPYLAEFPHALDWVVVGAASNGRNYTQPNPDDLARLMTWLDMMKIPVFFKGNLKDSFPDPSDWREDFPDGSRARLD